MARGLQVIEIGERMRFRITSEENPKWEYTVDLLENGGIGTCTCKWFQTHVWPAIRDGKLTLADTFPRHPCKHLQAARDHVNAQLYAEMAKRETQPT